MARLDRIILDPEVCAGRPCLRGMEVRVTDIPELLAAGNGRAEIRADFPYIEDEDISAALEYAARQADHPVIPVA